MPIDRLDTIIDVAVRNVRLHNLAGVQTYERFETRRRTSAIKA
jgi:hypothetical protein